MNSLPSPAGMASTMLGRERRRSAAGRPALASAASTAAAEAENAKLLELQAQLDHDSDTAVNAFNAVVKDHNLHVKQLNQDAAESQPVSNAYNADMLAYNRKCSPLVYRVDDLDAVLKERKKAAAQAAAASAP